MATKTSEELTERITVATADRVCLQCDINGYVKLSEEDIVRIAWAVIERLAKGFKCSNCQWIGDFFHSAPLSKKP